jgi:hypothetical protein
MSLPPPERASSFQREKSARSFARCVPDRIVSTSSPASSYRRSDQDRWTRVLGIIELSDDAAYEHQESPSEMTVRQLLCSLCDRSKSPINARRYGVLDS